MAASKSVSRKSAAKKASKTRKPRMAAKKAKPAANTNPPMQRPRPSEVSPAVAEIDERIATIRNNLRELVEQAASYSGAAYEELISQRISEQETKLEVL